MEIFQLPNIPETFPTSSRHLPGLNGPRGDSLQWPGLDLDLLHPTACRWWPCRTRTSDEVAGRPLVVSEFPSEFGPVGITEEGLVNGWFEVEIFPFFGGVGGEDGRTRFFNGLI